MADNIQKAAHAHTDLNIFAAIVSILEGGAIYSPASLRASKRIIAICKKEQDRLLDIYDDARTNG